MLTAKRCLVTGSSQGIGLSVAKSMLAAHASVLLTSEAPVEDLPAVQELLELYSGRAYYQQANLIDDSSTTTLLEAVWRRLGGLDVLVNNAGTFREPSFLELGKLHFDAIFGLNVWSALALTQGFVRRNIEARRGGRILFSTSLNATRSEPAHTLYDSSKSALNGLIRQLAIELAPMGFTTVGLAPGLVETPLTDFGLKSAPAERQLILDQIPLRRIATVEDLAGWYVFLASDAALYATGTIINVDGGLDAQQMASRPISAAERGLNL
jgi:glucose 1-dehydrogenase